MNQSLKRISAARGRPQTEVVDVLVSEAIRLTGSARGYFAVLSEDEAQLTMLGWSKSAMAACRMMDKPLDYPVQATGLWGDCVRERKAVITNDYPGCTRMTKKGYPDGHVDVVRHMNVPVMEGRKIRGIVGVGNRGRDYTAHDAEVLQAFANAAWPIFAGMPAGKQA